jgi:NTP pyrophosphatase (non-canonical NTP hydrolase)
MLARLVEEVGETARLINHLYGPKKKKDSEQAQELSGELADILFAVICLANSQGIDLQDAFEQMMQKYSVRDFRGRQAP